jgi:sRNA-binding carbon storage regulator CsrA
VLVITRKLTADPLQADVVIRTRAGEEILVRLCRVERGRCRLGFEADPGIVITRAELLPPAGKGGDPCPS